MAKLPSDIVTVVASALREDVGNGDLTARLVPEDSVAIANIVTRDDAVICGIAWVNEVFRQLCPEIIIDWHVLDGQTVHSGQEICRLKGPTRELLTGERTALNFLQTLSGTATVTRHYVDMLGDLPCKILDTRKTVPGLRTAQKYAVACGGGSNHRMGLYDAILLKENHITAAGSITTAVTRAKDTGVKVQVEVETLDELREAVDAAADAILLDNFTLEDMQAAVEITAGRSKLEASGGVDKNNLLEIARTGVDYISIGALTKHVNAIDFSMRFV